MTTQKVSRDVLDVLIRAIEDGIDIDGDCGGNFSIDGVPIGLNAECDAKFNDATVEGVLTANGGISAATGVLDMNGQRIVNVDDPVLATDAMNLQYADNNYIRLDGVGATMTAGFLTLANDPTAAFHAATRGWVLAQVAAAPALGVGQTWQNLSGSRSFNMDYPGDPTRSIMVAGGANVPSSAFLEMRINGRRVSSSDIDTIGVSDYVWHAGVVPPGGTYRINASGVTGGFWWSELR